MSEWELVMPFVVVESVGGPYPDEAFVAGWHCAHIRAALSHDGTSWRGPVRPGLLPQLDLIAMERGLTVTTESADDDWLTVSISQVQR